MTKRAALLAVLMLAACGGGGGSPSSPPVAIITPSLPTAPAVIFSDVGFSQSGHALFNPLSPHVASNSHGVWVLYQDASDYSTVPAHNTQRLVLNAGQGWTTVATFEATNVPCLAAEPSGAVWAASSIVRLRNPGETNPADEVQIIRWASPTATPQTLVVASEQGQNDKFGCAWDEGRKTFWFIGSGFELLRVNPDLTLAGRQDLADSALPYYGIYPGLRIAPDNSLELAWVTQGTDALPATHYRTMHFLRSNDGARWSANGLAPYAAEPGIEFANDETGSSLNIAPQFSSASKFLNTWWSNGAGSEFFLWWHVPQTGGKCFDPPSNCTLGFRRGQDVAHTTFGASGEIPRGAHGAVMGERGGKLYIVLAYDQKLVWFVSQDQGASWSLGGTATVPGVTASNCIRDFDGIQTASGFSGAMAIWHQDCPTWANGTTDKGPTRILAWTLTP